ncbi:MAG: spondin domain-containing protein [Planctomycetota bacterium]|jgi:hypothetical protein
MPSDLQQYTGRAVAGAVVVLAVLGLAGRALAQDSARYRLTVENTWSSATHPGAFPQNAHFSWLGGATHDESIVFWEEGELASPGIVQMAETGLTLLLEDAAAAAVESGNAGTVLAWHHWFCPAETTSASCGPLVVELDVLASHSRVTLVSMLGPSPDWFIGVSGLPLRDADGWRDVVVADLRPYDGGTRDANAFALFGPLTVPPEPISLITAESGQLIGPASLGSFTFERIDAPCPDADGNDVVDVDDLAGVLLDWGTDGSDHGGDVDGSGHVDIDDLLAVLLAWGPCGG